MLSAAARKINCIGLDAADNFSQFCDQFPFLGPINHQVLCLTVGFPHPAHTLFLTPGHGDENDAQEYGRPPHQSLQ